MYVLTAKAMGYTIGGGSPNLQVANTIAPLLTILFMLFGGLFSNVNSIPWVLRWLKNI